MSYHTHITIKSFSLAAQPCLYSLRTSPPTNASSTQPPSRCRAVSRRARSGNSQPIHHEPALRYPEAPARAGRPIEERARREYHAHGLPRMMKTPPAARRRGAVVFMRGALPRRYNTGSYYDSAACRRLRGMAAAFCRMQSRAQVPH